jgi:hypothetical protein
VGFSLGLVEFDLGWWSLTELIEWEDVARTQVQQSVYGLGRAGVL